MGSEAENLHILLFPFMAAGHMIPMVDLAISLARRGVRATIITTPANAPLIQPTLDRANGSLSLPIQLQIIPFSSTACGLPDGCENAASMSMDMLTRFLKAVGTLRQPFTEVFPISNPDAVISDSFLPWTLDVASEFGIPRLTFNGTGFFPQCAIDSVVNYEPHEKDEESFVLPGLPHRIVMLKSQIYDNKSKLDPDFAQLFMKIREADEKSYGIVVNSFYELEPDYADHCRKVLGRRAWHVGPVCLNSEDAVDRYQRGSKEAGIKQHECLDWLDNKQSRTVLYVCFGTMGKFTARQLREIALGLEACGKPFIWVQGKQCFDENDFLSEGYQKRVDGRGLIIRGWAPQMLILNHRAVGGFLTHCGWNSTLEAVSAGVPMVTWPLGFDQFYNERFIVDVLRVGVGVGVKEYTEDTENYALVKAEDIEKAVVRVMDGGEEAEEMRERGASFKESAEKALENGGSSYADIRNLIQELIDKKNATV